MILRFTRIWLPAIVVAVGVILWLVEPTVARAEGSAGIIGAGLSIWLLNVLYRIGVKGDHERTEEDDARAFFDEHGHWPDEPPPAQDRRRRRTARTHAPRRTM
ncbi:MAG TPA: hypothetical protein VNZ62_17830 [Capillimicrobium sp.]|nr:hypothetical protein [Capillimicrobium sp.]